mmetsp:Transcript_1680/g.3377  ORF Transcript_1680/g.3377 Transcript_1680/m.3377 type:complete len:232 (+) Transcript_1680:87-782(+)
MRPLSHPVLHSLYCNMLRMHECLRPPISLRAPPPFATCTEEMLQLPTAVSASRWERPSWRGTMFTAMRKARSDCSPCLLPSATYGPRCTRAISALCPCTLSGQCVPFHTTTSPWPAATGGCSRCSQVAGGDWPASFWSASRTRSRKADTSCIHLQLSVGPGSQTTTVSHLSVKGTPQEVLKGRRRELAQGRGTPLTQREPQPGPSDGRGRRAWTVGWTRAQSELQPGPLDG